MIAVLDALAAWREAEVTGLSCSHPFTKEAATVVLPSSRITAKPAGDFILPCAATLDVEERVKVEKDADLDTLVAWLRGLSGLIYYTADVRIHHHVLVSEQPEPDENGRWTALLKWKVVASWA